MTGFFNICTRDNVSLSFQAWDREMSMHFKDYFQKELRLSSQFPAFSIQLCPNCSSARTKEGSVEEGQVLVSSGHCWQLFSRTSNGQPGRLLLYLLQTALNSMGSNLLHCFFYILQVVCLGIGALYPFCAIWLTRWKNLGSPLIRV